MYAFIPVTGSQLLENIQITHLQVILSTELVIQPGKEAVLVKIIIHDLLPEIYMHFIIQYQGQAAGLEPDFPERKLREEIIPEFKIKGIAVCQFIIV